MKTKKWHLLGREVAKHCKWRQSDEMSIEGHNIEDKIHCTASKLDETWLKSSLTIYHYVKVQQLDDICETRR
jgi:uncharacterized protein (DUF2252 family)